MAIPSRTLIQLVALLPVQAWAQSSGASLVVELRRDALVDHARIVLSDVATVRASDGRTRDLGAIPLGRAPRIGYLERFSRLQIEHAIGRHVPESIAVQWEGATTVSVRTKAQVVPSRVLAEAAMDALLGQFAGSGATLEMQLGTPLDDIEVPFGPLLVRPRAVPAVVQGGRAPVWVDLFVGGEMYRSVVVRLAVAVRRQAYLAKHAISVGAMAGPDDFTVQEADVGGLEVVPAEQKLVPFRAARALLAGQALTTAGVLAEGRILRGDLVRVSIQNGPVGVETAGIAMADAGRGQMLSVRPAGSTDSVTGRVSQSGTVIIE